MFHSTLSLLHKKALHTPGAIHHLAPIIRYFLLVLTASFFPALVSASSALVRLTPSTSNRIIPGRTFAPYHSTDPFPFPIRTSVGLLVTGTSGKTFI
jgi:hypothetical protein